MKKLFILSAAGIVIAAAANAQTNVVAVRDDMGSPTKNEIKKEKKEERKELKKLKGNEVSYQSKQAFYLDFGDSPVLKWERTLNFDKATFTNNGQVMTAYYDDEAKLVGTVSDKTYSDLPVNARKIISEKYKDYIPESVILFDDNENNETDMILYENQFEDSDNYFVELQNGDKKIVLKVTMNGEVDYFTQMR